MDMNLYFRKLTKLYSNFKKKNKVRIFIFLQTKVIIKESLDNFFRCEFIIHQSSYLGSDGWYGVSLVMTFDFYSYQASDKS